MSQHFDIAVLGSGPGGYIAALKAGQMGAKVAVVEQAHLGGTCLNNGCIPSKALLASSELLYHIQHAGELGVLVSGVTFDWTRIQVRKDKILTMLRAGIKALFGGRKVALFQGRAVLNGPGRIAVCKDGAAAEEITATTIVIATGSLPSRIPGWPTDPNLVCTSDEALHWKALPKSVLIVGGGVIGCEFACILQPLGVQVTVVEMLPKLLPLLDGQIADALEKILAKRGIKCFTNTRVNELAPVPGGVKAVFSNGQSVTVEKVLVATGRKANTADLGLESVGLTTDRGFIRVNDRMETPVKGHYCIGDANGRCLLAHAASAHGVVAVENALGHARAFNAPVPNCVYTFPEIGTVGLTPFEARAKGLPVCVGSYPIGYLGKALAAGDTDGFVKVVRHRETGELLGVHMLGHNVTECIAAAGALLHQKVSVQDVAETVFAHPTISEAFKEAAEDALHMALHLPPRKLQRVVAVAG
ncbi:MAG: dihydrolipoyl dehydrogenase [Planctomycetota bacterium]|nr:dihydrolipoyl dehydrogenase [Planctomycetota bacterium]